jgi:hypothetical protein
VSEGVPTFGTADGQTAGESRTPTNASHVVCHVDEETRVISCRICFATSIKLLPSTSVLVVLNCLTEDQPRYVQPILDYESHVEDVYTC